MSCQDVLDPNAGKIGDCCFWSVGLEAINVACDGSDNLVLSSRLPM